MIVDIDMNAERIPAIRDFSWCSFISVNTALSRGVCDDIYVLKI